MTTLESVAYPRHGGDVTRLAGPARSCGEVHDMDVHRALYAIIVVSEGAIQQVGV